VPYLYSRIDGLQGRIDIADLGAHIGDFVTATLTRRGDVAGNPRDPEGNYYDLHAVLRFVQKALLEDPDYEPIVTVWQKKNPRRRWVLESQPGPKQRMVLQNRSFIMERVRLVEQIVPKP